MGTRRREAGFTLVELMVVVVILGILAGIATVGYRRYIGRARLSEAVALLAEMSSKEMLYFQEFAAYHPLRADTTVLPSPNEDVAGFYPISPSNGGFDSARVATSIANAAGWPASWRNVGLRPQAQSLYCTYMLNAGNAGQAVPAGFGTQMIAANGRAWFYALAACNLNGGAGFPAEVTTLGITSDSPALRTFNDGR